MAVYRSTATAEKRRDGVSKTPDTKGKSKLLQGYDRFSCALTSDAAILQRISRVMCGSDGKGPSQNTSRDELPQSPMEDKRKLDVESSTPETEGNNERHLGKDRKKHVPTRRLSRQWDKEIFHVESTGPWPHQESNSATSGRASLDVSDFEKSSPDSTAFSPMTAPLRLAGVEGVVSAQTPARELAVETSAATPDIYASIPCPDQIPDVPSSVVIEDDATSAFATSNYYKDGEFELGPESESTMFTVSQTYEKRIPLGWKIKAKSLKKVEKPKMQHMKPLAPTSSAATFSSTRTTPVRKRSKTNPIHGTSSSTFSIAERVNAVVKNARALMEGRKSLGVIKKKPVKTIHDKNVENSDSKSLKSVDLIAVAQEGQGAAADRPEAFKPGDKEQQKTSSSVGSRIRKVDRRQLEGVLSLDAPIYFFQPTLGDKMLLRDPLWKRKTDLRILANVETKQAHGTKSALTPPIPKSKAAKKSVLPEKVAVISAPSHGPTVHRTTAESPAAKYQRHKQELRRLSKEHEKKARKLLVPHGSKMLKRSSEELKLLSKKDAAMELGEQKAAHIGRRQSRAHSKGKQRAKSTLSRTRSRSSRSASKTVKDGTKDKEETAKTNTVTKDEGLGSDSSSIQLTKRASGGASRVLIDNKGRFVTQNIRQRRPSQKRILPQLNNVLSAGSTRQTQHVNRRPLDLSDFVPDRIGLREALYGAEERISEGHDARQAYHGRGDDSDVNTSSSVSLPDEYSGKFGGGAYDYEPPSAQQSSSSTQQQPSGRRDALGFTKSQERLLGSSGKTSSGKSRSKGALLPPPKGYHAKLRRTSSSVGHRSQRHHSFASINPRAVGLRHRRNIKVADPQEYAIDPHRRHQTQGHRIANGPEIIGSTLHQKPSSRPSASNVAAFPSSPRLLHQDGNAARKAILHKLKAAKAPRWKTSRESFHLDHLAVPPSTATSYSPEISSIHTSSGELLPAGAVDHEQVSGDAILEEEHARLIAKKGREERRMMQDLGKVSPRHDSDIPEVSASDATATNHTLSQDPFNYCTEEPNQELLPPSPQGTVRQSHGSGGTTPVPPGSSASGFFGSLGPGKALEAASSFFRKSFESINNLNPALPVVHESTFGTAPTAVAPSQPTPPPPVPPPSNNSAPGENQSKDDLKGGAQQPVKDETEHDEVSEHSKARQKEGNKSPGHEKDVDRGQGGAADVSCEHGSSGKSVRYQGGSSDGGSSCDKPDVALVLLERVKSLLTQMKSMKDEIIYLKEDIEELQFMHDCCGIDELITSRYKAKCKTAFPAATPECYENTVDGFRWMAYKNILNLWTLEYIEDIIEKRKMDKKGIHAKGNLFLDKRLEFFCDAPDLFYAKDFFRDVQDAEYTLATLVQQINAFEKTVPSILAAGDEIACSWKEKPHLQEAISHLAEYLRSTNASDSSTIQMFEQMIPGDPFDMMRILLAKEDGVTEIEETTGPYTPAFTPKKGTAVNYCEAKKLIHFLKYRHLHPAHKWPKKNKGGGTALLKAGSAGVEVDRDYEHDLNDDAEAVRQFETEYLFDLRKVALKRDYKGILGARKFEEEFQSRAKTTLFKITQFQEWVNQLHTGRDTPKSLDIGDIFPNVKMLKDFDAVRALLFNQPINMEKYGMPSERAAPQTFR